MKILLLLCVILIRKTASLERHLPTSSFRVPACLGVFCQNGGSVEPETCRCTCQSGWTGSGCEHQLIHGWPNANFAIPEHIFGCPEKETALWTEVGFQFQLTEEQSPDWDDFWPAMPHYRGPLEVRSWFLRLCMFSGRRDDANKPPTQWPNGQYCVYHPSPCPPDMFNDRMVIPGYERTDNNTPLPDFMYVDQSKSTVTLSLCCMDRGYRGSWPTDVPFILVKPFNATTCGTVRKMEFQEEWFKFPVNTSGEMSPSRLSTSGHLQLDYCVYTSTARRECGYEQDKFGSYRGRQNISEAGEPCVDWKMDSAILDSSMREDNFCRTIIPLDRPVCLVSDGLSGHVMQKRCDVEICTEKSISERYLSIGATAMMDTNLEQVEGEDLNTLSEVFNFHDSTGGKLVWVRLDLFVQHNIGGIFLQRDILKTHSHTYGSVGTHYGVNPTMVFNTIVRSLFGVDDFNTIVRCNGAMPHVWINMAVWIHNERDEFTTYGGHLCSEIEDLLELDTILITCTRQVTGRYVTIEMHTSALPESMHTPPEGYIFFLEVVEIYGSMTLCNQEFRSFKAMYDFQILTSHDDVRVKHLHPQEPDWACVIGDPYKIDVDLMFVTTVEGLLLWMTGPDVLTYTVVAWPRLDREYNVTEIHTINTKDNHTIYRMMFKRPLVTRLISLTFSFDGELCLKLDLIGCPKIINTDPFCSSASTNYGTMTSDVDVVQTPALHEEICEHTSNATDPDQCSQTCVQENPCLHWMFDSQEGSCQHYKCPSNANLTLLEDDTSDVLPGSQIGQALVGEKFCVKDVVEAARCRYNILGSRDQPVIISSPNYPHFYGAALDCEWRVHFPDTTGVKVTLLDVDLAYDDIPNSSEYYNSRRSTGTLWIHDGKPYTGKGFNTVLDAFHGVHFQQAELYLGHFSGYQDSTTSALVIKMISNLRDLEASARGFLLKVETTDCPGCKDDIGSCSGEMKTCAGQTCGYISSMVHQYFGPILYKRISRWMIAGEHLIKYKFLHFDIVGMRPCSRNGLIVYEGGQTSSLDFAAKGWTEVYRYCSSYRRPASVIFSKSPVVGFHFLDVYEDGMESFLLRWSSIVEEKGVKPLSYKRKINHYKRLLTGLGFDENDPILLSYFRSDFCTPENSMPLGDIQIFEDFDFNRCLVFGFYSRNTNEETCTRKGMRRLTIRSKKDLQFAGRMLLVREKEDVQIGMYRNVTDDKMYLDDGRPAVYIKWGVSAGSPAAEPDGAYYDTCVYVAMDATDETFKEAYMKTAPCNVMTTFWICEKDIFLPWQVEGVFVPSNISEAPISLTYGTSNVSQAIGHMYQCMSGEWILDYFRCDDQVNCADGSDELDCGTLCGEDTFPCGDGLPCIHVQLTCDFNLDCPNGADEVDCVFRECDADEWRCANGQCITNSSYMDMAFDCFDRSDETTEEEGILWHISLLRFVAASPSNEFRFAEMAFTVYDVNGPAPEVNADAFGPINDLNITLGIRDPVMFRLKLASTAQNNAHLDTVLMRRLYDNKEFLFKCDCVLPDPSQKWFRQKHLSVTDEETQAPLLPTTTYTVTIVCQHDGSLTNKLYINIVGQHFDSRPLELNGLLGTNEAETFTYVLANFGQVSMIKVYFYGLNLFEELEIDSIVIHDSSLNETTSFQIQKKFVLKDDLDGLEQQFDASDSPLIPEYIKNRRECPPSMIRCFDGTCLPDSYFCDRITHCSGTFHEDEPLICSPVRTPQYCDHYLTKDGLPENEYPIEFIRKKGTLQHCVYKEEEGVIESATNNILRSTVTVGGRKQFTYKLQATGQKIQHIVRLSDKCLMAVTVHCYMTLPSNMADRISVAPSGGAEIPLYSESHIAICLSNTTGDRRDGCNCLKTKDEWLAFQHRGYETDTFVFDDPKILPLQRVFVKENPLDSLHADMSRLFCYKNIGPFNTRCRNGMVFDISHRCLYRNDRYGRIVGCKDLSHLEDCEDYICPDGFVKCSRGFCIPDFFVCNGIKECSEGEDEFFCQNHTVFCEDRLKCRGSNICVSDVYICDGHADCPLNDDELFCNSDLSRTLDQDFVPIDTDVKEYLLGQTHSLVGHLDMSHLQLEYLDPEWFLGLHNLLKLDLSHNKIWEILPNTFIDLKRLTSLNLIRNALSLIHPGAFEGLQNLQELSLVQLQLTAIAKGSFDGLDSLKLLNLSLNRILVLEANAFVGLDSLRLLDLRSNRIDTFSNGVFNGLSSLQKMWSDLHLLCCLRPSSVTDSNCFPQENEFSSCDDLMRNEVLRGFLWVIGAFALIGNMLAMLYRFTYERRGMRTNHGILVSNLNGADFMMGLYLIIVAGADTHFRGSYVWNDISWRSSPLCKIAGFLAFVSVEASSGFLCLITVDRLLTFRFTMERRNFTRNSALVACASVWSVCVILGALPLVLQDTFDPDFYTKNGVCLALPFTRQRFAGEGYATAIFVFVNFVMFALIAVGQLQLFREIRRATMKTTAKSKRDELVIARKLFLVVMTNFLCLFPICIMGLLAMGGFVFNSEVYAWVAVFVLPLNSATNPILYTLSSIVDTTFGHRVRQMLRIGSRVTELTETEEKEKTQQIYDRGVFVLSNQPDMVSLADYLNKKRLLTVRNLVVITARLAHTLDFLHGLGYIMGPLSTREVLIQVDKVGLVTKIRVVAMPVRSDHSKERANDVGNLGLLMKKVVRLPRSLKIISRVKRGTVKHAP